MNHRYDVAIVGSGFSGSILARILSKSGRRVVLIDSASHPRFAIGESSTPIADLLLKRVGEAYDLPDLEWMSTHGSWQGHLGHLPCGLKRGFSYFDHRDKSACLENQAGQRSLVVAASPSDERSDTHWYRPDVDACLFGSAIDSGVEAIENTTVVSVVPGDCVGLELSSGQVMETNFLVDATGPAAAIARLIGARPMTASLETNTNASYGHFKGVDSFSELFRLSHRGVTQDDPFNADDAAQHHLIENGWAWMLRMNNGVTSVGCVQKNGLITTADSRTILESLFIEYPSMHAVMREARCVAPPVGIVGRERIQQLFEPAYGNNIVLMPTSALTLDPLHSTGIAHALAGVQRIARMVIGKESDLRGDLLRKYRESFTRETRLLDTLVSTAYSSMHSFDRFTAACMVYFSAAISCEERILAGEEPQSLWQSDDPLFVQATCEVERVLKSELNDKIAIDKVRRLIEPWNSAGLLDESVQNRYRYTATK